jgi:hypothetical protein
MTGPGGAKNLKHPRRGGGLRHHNPCTHPVATMAQLDLSRDGAPRNAKGLPVVNWLAPGHSLPVNSKLPTLPVLIREACPVPRPYSLARGRSDEKSPDYTINHGVSYKYQMGDPGVPGTYPTFLHAPVPGDIISGTEAEQLMSFGRPLAKDSDLIHQKVVTSGATSFSPGEASVGVHVPPAFRRAYLAMLRDLALAQLFGLFGRGLGGYKGEVAPALLQELERRDCPLTTDPDSNESRRCRLSCRALIEFCDEGLRVLPEHGVANVIDPAVRERLVQYDQGIDPDDPAAGAHPDEPYLSGVGGTSLFYPGKPPTAKQRASAVAVADEKRAALVRQNPGADVSTIVPDLEPAEEWHIVIFPGMGTTYYAQKTGPKPVELSAVCTVGVFREHPDNTASKFLVTTGRRELTEADIANDEVNGETYVGLSDPDEREIEIETAAHRYATEGTFVIPALLQVSGFRTTAQGFGMLRATVLAAYYVPREMVETLRTKLGQIMHKAVQMHQVKGSTPHLLPAAPALPGPADAMDTTPAAIDDGTEPPPKRVAAAEDTA